MLILLLVAASADLMDCAALLSRLSKDFDADADVGLDDAPGAGEVEREGAAEEGPAHAEDGGCKEEDEDDEDVARVGVGMAMGVEAPETAAFVGVDVDVEEWSVSGRALVNDVVVASSCLSSALTIISICSASLIS